MDNIFNKVKDAVVDHAMGSNDKTESPHGYSHRENESPYGSSGRQGDNTNTYESSYQDGAPTTYAASRADVENTFSSGNRRDNDSSLGQGGSYGSGRQDQDSYGSSSYRQDTSNTYYGSSRRDNEDTYGSNTRYEDSGFGGHSRRKHDTSQSAYNTSQEGVDSTHITPGDCVEEGSSYGGRSVTARDGYYIPEDLSSREYRPAQGSGGLGMMGRSDNYGEASSYAEKHAGSGRDGSMFSTAIGYLSGRERNLEQEDIDEREFTSNHREIYEEDGGPGQRSTTSLGQAAAMQALKHFNKGSHSSGSDQNAFIGMAMAEAAKLFDSQSSQGNVQYGSNKQDVINSAAQMALKLLLKSKLDAATGGSGGGLMSMASKFLQ